MSAQGAAHKETPKETFYRQFQGTVANLQEHINHLANLSAVAGERHDTIEHILTGISRLSNEVADAADYVPAYDQRTYSQALKQLTDQLNEAQAQFRPKSRFQFKRRNPPSGGDAMADKKNDARYMLPAGGQDKSSSPSAVTAVATANGSKLSSEDRKDSLSNLPSFPAKNYNEEIAKDSTDSRVRKPSFSTARDITLSDHDKLHIILPLSASRATSAGALTNMKGCIVDMSVPTRVCAGGAPFASLALKNISGSLIVAGHVDGPVHITGLRDSKVLVVARQVRIHECENVDFYLYCASRPIIEDCKALRFAPAPKFHSADKDENTNMWDQVDDFKWLKAEHSPNWSVLPEEQRIAEDIWKDKVPGYPGAGLDDILSTVGIGAEA
ncbi:tubulin binding cofactor C-domain-containing protein [Neurospora hispaniola]|uniref:Tubulin binding cofactor C-domain-containing protein n=1 Tax=Neurospora hispaniola TaxID=588809 RepID=A0AAJ0MMU5_9PEZI|nr:tubulin binding cofactor C-domain-containing protein [Neurospora hispaniola]